MDMDKIAEWYNHLDYKMGEQKKRIVQLKKKQEALQLLAQKSCASDIMEGLHDMMHRQKILLYEKIQQRRTQFNDWSRRLKKSESYSFLLDLYADYQQTDSELCIEDFKKLMQCNYPQMEIVIVGSLELVRCEMSK